MARQAGRSGITMQTIWLRALRQERLDLTFRSGPATIARIVERPGAWMAPADLEQLAADLRTIARRTLPDGDLTYGVLSGEAEALARSIVTIIYDRDSRQPLAFNALAAMEVMLHGRREEVLHLGLVMIDRRRAAGASPGCCTASPAWCCSCATSSATVALQRDAGTGGRRHNGGDVLRRLSELGRRHAALVQPSRAGAADHGASSSRVRRRRGCLSSTGASSSATPIQAARIISRSRSRTPPSTAIASQRILRARARLRAGRRCAADRPHRSRRHPPLPARRRARRSLPGVLGALAFVALQRCALPLVYWFSPGRA